MTTPVTQIFVASEQVSRLVVVAPPYTLLAGVFLACGLCCGLVGLVLVVVGCLGAIQRSPTATVSVGALPVLLCFGIGIPFVVVAVLTGSATRVTVSPDLLKVQRTFLTFPVKTRSYTLDQVRFVQVGMGNTCLSLQAVMNDGRGETLIGCTDLTGYNEVADAINRFLIAHR
ncbi:hypothetical protein [Granulicella sp. S190]|uniref:hypothetical protein n=1 Tax=Granulicella sp. S190 TaxID=1747226 RepID=UPI00131A8AF5|nr:hypothetical protein [Granulicella sp. S190]